MKKFLFVVLLALMFAPVGGQSQEIVTLQGKPPLVSSVLSTVATAQSHYYHLVGDTVRGRCPIYYYQWWPTSLNADNTSDSLVGTGTVGGYMRFTTDSTLHIIGVASTVMSVNRADWYHQYEWIDTNLDTAQHYTLYGTSSDGIVELASVCWSDDYPNHSGRFLELPLTYPPTVVPVSQMCDTLVKDHLVLPLREYYFDNPVTVHDSFYLGWQWRQRSGQIPEERMVDYAEYLMIRDFMNTSLSQYGYKADCEMDVHAQTYIMHPNNNWETFSRNERKELLLIFPIIEVDTTNLPYDTSLFSCPVPRPNLLSRDDVRARVGWDAQTNSRWEVSVTTAGVSPDNGRIIATSSNYVDLYGLSRDSTYQVYVRGWCTALYYEGWSDWSVPLDVVGTVSIDDVPSSSAAFTLTPNPASGTVTVALSAAAQGTVAVLDLQGRHLLSAPLTSASATIDISALPPATYIVALTTDQGTATRKLTVN